ncbi:hypothetical protein ES703_63398 [subsurface metagenome]
MGRVGDIEMPEHLLVDDLIAGGAHQHRDIGKLRRALHSPVHNQQFLLPDCIIKIPGKRISLGLFIGIDCIIPGRGLIEEYNLRLNLILPEFRLKLLKLCLIILRAFFHNPGEEPVKEMDQSRFTAVISVQLDGLPALPQKLSAQMLKDTHIGAAEAVDRLLLIPHKKEFVRLQLMGPGDFIAQEILPLCQKIEQILLRLIVILELIDHDIAKALLIEPAQGLVDQERPDGHLHHILKSEHPGASFSGLY